MRADLKRRALRRAAEIVGGKDKLAVYLGTDKVRLARWLKGNGRPPLQVLQCVAALIRYTMLEGSARNVSGTAAPRSRRSGRRK